MILVMAMTMMLTLLDLQSILSFVQNPLFCCSLTVLTKLMVRQRHGDAGDDDHHNGVDDNDKLQHITVAHTAEFFLKKIRKAKRER